MAVNTVTLPFTRQIPTDCGTYLRKLKLFKSFRFKMLSNVLLDMYVGTLRLLVCKLHCLFIIDLYYEQLKNRLPVLC